MKTKEFRAEVKAIKVDGEADGGGYIEAIVSVFNNVDHYGEVVMPGAFKATLADWEERGDPIPFIWSHDWSDPFAHIGVVKSAEETEKGLKILAYISPEEREENPKAAQVYRLLKARRVTQFSFGFDVDAGGMGERSMGDGEKSEEVYELRELTLHEVGPCLLGVNPDTELIAVKARRLDAAILAGNPKALASVQEALTLLEAVLADAQGTQTPVDHPADGKESSQETTPDGNEAPAPSASAGNVIPASAQTTTLLLDLAIAEAEAE